MEARDVIFDGRVFAVEAVKNAAYRLANLLDSEIRLEGDRIVCSVKTRAGLSPDDMEGAVSRLRREVIDHDLRLQIREKTEPTRNLILALAFSRTGVVQSE
jgi:His-Xaa-Ser system protein HxsD